MFYENEYTFKMLDDLKKLLIKILNNTIMKELA